MNEEYEQARRATRYRIEKANKLDKEMEAERQRWVGYDRWKAQIRIAKAKEVAAEAKADLEERRKQTQLRIIKAEKTTAESERERNERRRTLYLNHIKKVLNVK